MSRQQRQQEISALERKLRDLKHEEQRQFKARSILDDHSRGRFLETYRKKKQPEQTQIDQMEQSIKAKQGQIRELEDDIKQMRSAIEETDLKQLESFMRTYSYYHGGRDPPIKMIQVYTHLLEDDIAAVLKVLGHPDTTYPTSQIGKLICDRLGHFYTSSHICSPCFWCTSYKHKSKSS